VGSERESIEEHYKKYHDMSVDLPSVVFPERALRMRQSLACSGCSMSGDEGPGEAVWAAGVALAVHISQSIPPGHRSDETIAPWRGVNVLELGSGTGVAGIAAAVEGANVLLTDRDSLMPLMAKNVRLNQDYIEIGSADYEAFDWAMPPPKEVFSESWDVVLCAESVTRSTDVHPFVDTLASLLGPDGAGAGATAIYAHHPSASQSQGLGMQLQSAFKARGLRCKSLPPLSSWSADQEALGEVVFWTLQGSSREGAGSRVRAWRQRLAGMLKAFVLVPQSVR
jgi:2-polyprenyl-3-methyl-5-hydroxy-6-metoxy-1,4-benzoquinol methylase